MADPFIVAARIALEDTTNPEAETGVRYARRQTPFMDKLEGSIKNLHDATPGGFVSRYGDEMQKLAEDINPFNITKDAVMGDVGLETEEQQPTYEAFVDIDTKSPDQLPKDDMIFAIEAVLRKQHAGLADTFAVAGADGDFSQPEAIAALERVARDAGGSISMTPQDMQNALDGMSAMGIDPNGNTEAMMGMAVLNEAAAKIEQTFAPGGWEPEAAVAVDPPKMQ